MPPIPTGINFGNGPQRGPVPRRGQHGAQVLARPVRFHRGAPSAARALAVRALLRDAANQAARLQWLFARVTARRPVAEELKILVALLDDQRIRFRAHPASARELLSVGSSPIDGRVEVVEQAAWTALCSVLLNTDEAITRE